MNFNTFENKYILEGELIVLTALHIGSGIEKDSKDAPFISLDDENEFYIPGSSFRGYLSTKLERYLDKSNKFKIKEAKTNKVLNVADVKLIFGYTNLDKEDSDIQERIKEKLEEEDIKKIKNLAGRIYIPDMYLKTKVESVTRDGIKIDRETGATQKGGKFDYDVVPSGTIFKFILELENIEDYQLDLVGLALGDILQEDGDLIGGKTARGIGRCKLDNLKLSYVESKDTDAVEKYIFKKEFEEKNIKENYKFTTENITI